MVIEFQSLFLWNSRPDCEPLIWTPQTSSFNPCFCGTRARTTISKAPYFSRELVSILVFVELAPGHQMKGPETDHKWCFNPCFCGTRARTRLSVLWADLVCGFQSLFLWNSRPDDCDPKSPIDLHQFQSLFLWNSRPDKDGVEDIVFHL